MNTEGLWCAVCNRTVAVVVEEAASAMLVPILGTAGGALGASKHGARGGLAGAVLGIAAGLLVQGLIPKAQRLVCRECRHNVG